MEQINFKKLVNNFVATGYNPCPDKVYIAIKDSRTHLWGGLRHFLGEDAKWLSEYEDVAKWLENNAGKGLLCYGNCGRGKSLICSRIIPLLLYHYHQKVVSCYDAQQMNADIDQVKAKHIIYIDDIGVENVSIKYGEKRFAFPEIVDESEKRGKLLIITTNLSLDELAEKYGERTVDRLIAITQRILFKGKSLRK